MYLLNKLLLTNLEEIEETSQRIGIKVPSFDIACIHWDILYFSLGNISKQLLCHLLHQHRLLMEKLGPYFPWEKNALYIVTLSSHSCMCKSNCQTKGVA